MRAAIASTVGDSSSRANYPSLLYIEHYLGLPVRIAGACHKQLAGMSK
jgi:hypothetical protein